MDPDAYEKEINQLPEINHVESAYLYKKSAICPDPPSIKEQLKKMYKHKRVKSEHEQEARAGLILSQYPLDYTSRWV